MSAARSPAAPDLVPMIGARNVRVSEPDAGERWNEGLIKELTGGAPDEVRAARGAFVEVTPDFNVRISGRDDEGSGDR